MTEDTFSLGPAHIIQEGALSGQGLKVLFFLSALCSFFSSVRYYQFSVAVFKYPYRFTLSFATGLSVLFCRSDILILFFTNSP